MGEHLTYMHMHIIFAKIIKSIRVCTLNFRFHYANTRIETAYIARRTAEKKNKQISFTKKKNSSLFNLFSI